VGELTVNGRIGISIFPRDGVTGDTLIMSADIAMYRAKQSKCGYAFASDNPKQFSERAISNCHFELVIWQRLAIVKWQGRLI
jgi:predicted signal transduction protein with EAL and GGDEF domain